MKLYWLPLSPNNFPVSALADHLGVALERIYLDPTKGETQRPEFLKINPNGKCPTLVDEDFVLWESNAIMQYLCSKKPEAGLWPADERSRIDISRWLLWQQAHWMNACGGLLWQKFIKKLFGQGDPDPAEVKKGEERVRQFGSVLDQSLEGKSYLVGNRLSIADFAVAAPLPFAEACGFPLDGLSNIPRWYRQIAQLEAWQKNLPKLPIA